MNVKYIYILDFKECAIDEIRIDCVRDNLTNEEVENILDFHMNYNLDEISFMISDKQLDITRLNFIYHA